MAKFSIITVCYNSEKTIERTLLSVLNQTCTDYEYIIIDGASTDHTMDIVRKYEERFQGRMKIVSEPDNGIYDAMNKGIALARGELIGIVNSDDYYEKDALGKIIEAYDGSDYCIVYGLLRKVHKGKEISVYMNSPDFIENTMITHPTCFITKKVYDTFGNYSLAYKYSADYEFMLRIRNNKEIRYIPVYSIISNFTIDGASGSVKAYRDTLRLKYEYGLLDGYSYWFPMVKSWIAMKLGR